MSANERERALEAARFELESLDAEASRVREEHSALRAGLAGLEERFRAQSTAFQRLDAQSLEITNRRRNLGAEIERMGEHRSRLLAENIELDKRDDATGRGNSSPRSTGGRAGQRRDSEARRTGCRGRST